MRFKTFSHFPRNGASNFSENSELSYKSGHRLSRGQIKISALKAFLISHVSTGGANLESLTETSSAALNIGQRWKSRTRWIMYRMSSPVHSCTSDIISHDTRRTRIEPWRNIDKSFVLHNHEIFCPCWLSYYCSYVIVIAIILSSSG